MTTTGRRWWNVCGAFALLGGAAACGAGEVESSSQCSACCCGTQPPIQVGAEPPAPGPESEVDGAGVTLAIRRVFFGDTRRDGVADVDAWRSFGFDLDHSDSAAGSTSSCIPHGGGYSDAANQDGLAGRDNAFGSALLPIFLQIFPDFPALGNNELEQGGNARLIDISGIGTGPEYNPVSASAYAGARLFDGAGQQVAPKWDGTDVWPILDMEGSLEAPLIAFPASYVVTDSSTGARVWVSGPPDPASSLKLATPWIGPVLTIHAPLLTVELSGDNAEGKNGTIAGVLDPAEMICEMELLLAKGGGDELACWLFSPHYPPTEEPMIRIPEMCDVALPSGPDSSGACNGISIGLGFEARAVKLGPVAPDSPPPTDTCSCP